MKLEDRGSDLPESVIIVGKSFSIRDKCDYRIIKKCIRALKDSELDEETAVKCAAIIFYEDYSNITDFSEAVKQMYSVIGCENQYKSEYIGLASEENELQLMDWDYDWDILAPALSRVLGYDVRTSGKYTHWWSLVGAYMEIGECTFRDVVSIRQKLRSGKPLESYERKFYNENRETVDLPLNLSAEEREFLENG